MPFLATCRAGGTVRAWGGIFLKIQGGGGSGHNQLPTMTFCLLPDFLAQWAENISEADFFLDFVFWKSFTI